MRAGPRRASRRPPRPRARAAAAAGLLLGRPSPDGAACRAVGDEVLAGAHPDLNSPFLARRLPELGRRVERVLTVGDDVEAIAEHLEAHPDQDLRR